MAGTTMASGSVGTAVGIVVARPRLWLLGTLGFFLRGGLLLLSFPILTLPGPVAISTLLGPELLGTDLTPRLVAIVALGLLALVGALVLAVAGAASVEAASFAGLLGDPEALDLVPEAWREPAATGRGVLRSLVSATLICYLPAAVLIVYAAVASFDAIAQELVAPGSPGVPLELRVLARAALPIGLALVALLGGEVVASRAARTILIAAHGLHPLAGADDAEASVPGGRAAVSAALRALRRRPQPALAASLVGWAVTLGVMVPTIGSIAVAWTAVRGHYLRTGHPFAPDAAAATVALTLIFAALWASAATLAGVASAVRAAILTAASLD